MKHEQNHQKHPVRTALLIAAAVVVLVAGAFAAYQYSIRDLEINSDSASPTTTEETHVMLSAVGYKDTAEYMAFQEWYNWQSAYEVDPADDNAPELAGDKWYYTLYGAANLEMADKLDDIAAKYGLTLHREREEILTEQALYDCLDTDEIFRFEPVRFGGYIYEDGSFNAELQRVESEDVDAEEWLTLFCNVRGTFAEIALPGIGENCEEWVYESVDGVSLNMALGDKGFLIVANLDGCFVSAGQQGSYDRAYVEQTADSIDFAALDACFGADYSAEKMTESVADYVQALHSSTAYSIQDKNVEAALAEIGDYTLLCPPTGYYLYSTSARESDGRTSISRSYSCDDGGDSIGFFYSTVAAEADMSGRAVLDRYLSSNSGLASFIEQFQYKVFECEVAGCEAVLLGYNEDDMGRLYWYDEEKNLLFCIDAYSMPRDALLQLAEETVTGVAHDTPVVIDRLDATPEQEGDLAREELGDYELTILPDGYSEKWVNGDYLNNRMDPVYLLTTDVNCGYLDENSNLIDFNYRRCYDRANPETVMLTPSFEQSRQDSQDMLEMEEDASGMTFEDCEVNGCEAFYFAVGVGGSLCWLDEDAQLIFTIGTDLDMTMDELITLAESVQTR